jgi:hypothetical protein
MSIDRRKVHVRDDLYRRGRLMSGDYDTTIYRIMEAYIRGGGSVDLIMHTLGDNYYTRRG